MCILIKELSWYLSSSNKTEKQKHAASTERKVLMTGSRFNTDVRKCRAGHVETVPAALHQPPVIHGHNTELLRKSHTPVWPIR